MQPDLAAHEGQAWLPPRLTKRALQGAPIALMTRDLDPAVVTALAEMPPEAMPRFRFTCEADAFGSLATRALAQDTAVAGWLAEWLVYDVGFLARLFADLIGADLVAIRLDVVRDDSCRYFHADNVSFRLVTTYRGPGTQWVDSAYGSERSDVLPEAIRQMERGWIAVMRGAKAATPNAPPLLHRSPPIGKSGTTRLFLAIDDGSSNRAEAK
jgi:hypothetical protein